jgi:hypothetical protein
MAPMLTRMSRPIPHAARDDARGRRPDTPTTGPPSRRSPRPRSVAPRPCRSGVSPHTCRTTTPSASSSLSRAHSMRSLISGMASWRSVKRLVPASSSRTIAPDHRRPISSTALWKAGQKFELCDIEEDRETGLLTRIVTSYILVTRWLPIVSAADGRGNAASFPGFDRPTKFDGYLTVVLIKSCTLSGGSMSDGPLLLRNHSRRHTDAYRSTVPSHRGRHPTPGTRPT